MNGSDTSQLPQFFDLTAYFTLNTQVQFVRSGNVKHLFYTDNVDIDWNRHPFGEKPQTQNEGESLRSFRLTCYRGFPPSLCPFYVALFPFPFLLRKPSPSWSSPIFLIGDPSGWSCPKKKMDPR